MIASDSAASTKPGVECSVSPPPASVASESAVT
jgi:hypothetical protein